MDLFQNQRLSPETLSEIRKLHFRTKRMATEGLAGQYRSAFRGRGMEFEEVREYFPGDDIRSIDWKVTARSRKPYVKSFREERELTVMIAVDVSASALTGTRGRLRESVLAQVGAVLTLIALRNNDRVGLVTYSNKLETFHPPRKGRSAVWRILHEVMAPHIEQSTTDLGGLCAFLSRVLKRPAVVFILSDFHASGYERELSILAKKHDVTAVTVSDPTDTELPLNALVEFQNPETGERVLLDLTDNSTLETYKLHANKWRTGLDSLLRRCRVSKLQLSTEKNFLPVLQRFFTAKSSVSSFS